MNNIGGDSMIKPLNNMDCSTCAHSDVCMYKDDFKQAIEKINKVKSELPEIFSGSVKCDAYSQKCNIAYR